MKCTDCGSEMRQLRSDLPFKTADHSIIVVKDLPVLQCVNCPQYLLEDAVMDRVDAILARASGEAELEVVGFAA
jgi:YgiT-type zinc finger domain-containing protein